MRFLPALLLLTAWPAYGACPDWLDDKSVPQCPDGTRCVLPETNPVAAHVVADKPALHVWEDNPDYKALKSMIDSTGRNFVREYTEQVLRAAGSRVPLVFLPIARESYDAIKAHIGGLEDVSEETRRKWTESLVQVEIPTGFWGDETPWQRDGLLPVVDGTTGKVQLRRLNDHPGTFRLSVTLAEAMAKACDRFERGEDIARPRPPGGPPDLPPGLGENISGLYGGNILALPGGICARGDNQEAEFARQYCPNDKDHLELDVSWLYVGHVDELFTLVRTNGAGPCDFALTMPSVRRALALMGESRDRPFFDFGARGEPSALVKRQWLESPGLKDLCRVVERHRKAGGETPKRDEEHGWLRLVPPAFAASLPCEGLTNGEALDALRADENFSRYQDLVQEKLDAAAARVKAKVRERLGCEPRVIEAPNLYHGGEPVTEPGGRFSLPAERAKTILPNSANLVSQDRHALVPLPRNPVFERHLDGEFQRHGVKRAYVDTWDYGHRSGGGNLHCVTLTVPYCRGRGK